MEEESMKNEVEEEEFTKIEIQDLPLEVLDFLVGFLDYNTRRTCRLVSHFLKDSVDDVGISAKIDDQKPESIAFCRSVNTTEVQIEQMLDPSLNLNMRKWKTVLLSGPIDSGWLNNSLLRNSPNLRVLFLDGSCLTSRDFGDPLLDPSTFDHLTQIHCYAHLYFKKPGKNPLVEDAAFKTRLDQNILYLLGSLRSRVLKVLSIYICHRELVRMCPFIKFYM